LLTGGDLSQRRGCRRELTNSLEADSWLDMVVV
jgi:hypothetical protein